MSTFPRRRRILGVLCVLVLCGILVAGLWPFHSPMNQVSWLQNASGIRFGRHGTALSLGSFRASGSGNQASFSLEIWLQPSRVNESNTLLAFYSPGSRPGFALSQDYANLEMQTGIPDVRIAHIDDIFRRGKPLFITVTSSRQGTAVYVNGNLASKFPRFRLSADDLAGQLVLGTSPLVDDAFSGQLRGLAIYQQELAVADVARHFETWTAKGRPDIGRNERVRALYLFDERQGRAVHGRGSSAIDLYIPERYLILREKLLEPPWKEFYPGWTYWMNVGINIGGFIPLGFLFCAYLTSQPQVSRPALVTILLGAAISLTIEFLQGFLPTRNSGMTDIVTNTLGTGCGVMLQRWKGALLDKSFRLFADDRHAYQNEP